MNKTNQAGLVAELAFSKRAVQLGWKVFTPLSTERYDLLIQRDSHSFERIQVKCGRIKNNCVLYNTTSNSEGVGKPVNYVLGEDIDGIGVYAPEIDQCFLVTDHLPKGNGTLRLASSVHAANITTRWANDYRL